MHNFRAAVISKCSPMTYMKKKDNLNQLSVSVYLFQL